MRKGLKKLLRKGGIAACVFILLLAVAVLFFVFDKPLTKNVIQRYLAKKTGVAVQIGTLDYDLFPLHIVMTSLRATYKTPVLNADILVNRVEAKGALKKLLNGDAAAFDTAEIDIADLRVNQGKSSETPTDFGSLILQAAGLLSFAQRVSLKCGRMGFSLPAQNFRLEEVDLGLAGTSAAGTYDFLLDARYIGVAANAGTLALESRLHADGTLALARTAGIKLRLTLDSPRFAAAGKNESFKALTTEADGVWLTGENKFSLTKFALDVPGLIAVTGSGYATLGKTRSLDLSARAQIDDFESIEAIAAPYLPSAIRKTQIQGKVWIEGRFSLAPGQQINAGKLEGSVKLDDMKINYAKAGLPIRGQLSGLMKFVGSPSDVRISASVQAEIGKISKDNLNIQQSSLHGELTGALRLAGTLPDIEASADVRASTGRIFRDNFDVQQSSARFKVKATRSAADITDFEGTLRGLTYLLPGGKGLAFDEVNFDGAARLDFNNKSIVLTAFETRLPNLAPFRLAGRFDLSPQGTKQARFESKGLEIQAVRGLLARFIPEGLASWEFDGNLDVGIQAGSLPGRRGVWEYSGEFTLSQIKFSDPSFTIAGDGLQPVGKIEGTYEPVKDALTWRGSIELSQGESLWKDLYISWSKQPLLADIAGQFSRDSMSIDGLSAKIVFPKLGEIHAGGSVHLGASSSFRLQAGARLSLEPFNALYSQAGAGPKSWKSTSGELSGDFAIEGAGNALSVKGRLRVGEAAVESARAKVLVRGITADVPVNYMNGPAMETLGALGRVEPFERGEFRVQEMRTPFYSFPPTVLTVRCLPNAYRIDAFPLDIFGARLEFGETALALDPRTGAFRGGTSLKLSGLDLSRLPVASTQFPLSGQARADFPILDITLSEIRTKGQAEISIFGGQVVIRDVSVAAPFTLGRAISCNVDLLNLDLKKVTDVVPFGEMTGIVRGEILGLTISYGQPESFNLSLESVPRKGVAQNFSLKAVDNLTVLSSGQQASMGSSQFWMRFIRGFRYKKMGISSTLKNDTFTLNGTIHEKGVEYLVKKPALFGINVINRMPDKKISFKEMMSRLERVGKSEKSKVK